MLFKAPTVAQLAVLLQRDGARNSWSSLVSIQPLGARPPFFCVHAVGGNVLEYYDLARYLGPDQPFYGFQSRGVDSDQRPHERIEEMAAHYVQELREFQPHGPYFIGGRSLGGIIAYEMACQLRALGDEVSLLALLDSYPAGFEQLQPGAGSLTAKFARLRQRAAAHRRNLRLLRGRNKLSYLANKSQYGPVQIKNRLWRAIYRSYQNLGRNLPPVLRDVEQFNWLAARRYRPQPYAGKATLFWASTDLRASVDQVEGWRALATGGLEVIEIPGTHLDLIKEPHVAELATKLSASLTKAQSSSQAEA